MLNKLKASLGIGAAKVDTILDSMSVTQGDTLTGRVEIFGGNVEQRIDAIHLKLCTEVKVDSDNGASYQNFILAKIAAVEPFDIGPGEQKSVPFHLQLDDETPVTALNAHHNQCHVWVETSLDIEFAIDPRDRDFIEVHPLPVVAKIIRQIESSGFSLMKADVEKGYLRGNGFSSNSGCYQEIEFRGGGLINNKEIELSFILAGDSVHCLAEVDRSLSLSGDQYISFTLSRDASDSEVDYQVKRILAV